MTARSHQRPCGASTARTGIQRVCHRGWPGSLAQSRPTSRDCTRQRFSTSPDFQSVVTPSSAHRRLSPQFCICGRKAVVSHSRTALPEPIPYVATEAPKIRRKPHMLRQIPDCDATLGREMGRRRGGSSTPSTREPLPEKACSARSRSGSLRLPPSIDCLPLERLGSKVKQFQPHAVGIDHIRQRSFGRAGTRVVNLYPLLP